MLFVPTSTEDELDVAIVVVSFVAVVDVKMDWNMSKNGNCVVKTLETTITKMWSFIFRINQRSPRYVLDKQTPISKEAFFLSHW